MVNKTGHPKNRQRNTTTVWNFRGVKKGLRTMRIRSAGMFHGGWNEKMASDFTPSNVRTALRYNVSAIASLEMSLKILDKIDTRTVTGKQR